MPVSVIKGTLRMIISLGSHIEAKQHLLIKVSKRGNKNGILMSVDNTGIMSRLFQVNYD